MYPWEFSIPSFSSLFCLENFYSSQPELSALKNSGLPPGKRNLIISGSSGNGITHLLQGIGIREKQNGTRVIYLTSEWLTFWLKNIRKEELEKFRAFLVGFDLIILDNLQFVFYRSRACKEFILDLQKDSRLLLGCSLPEKDFTKSADFRNRFDLERILIKPLNGEQVYLILKDYCKFEPSIPDSLLYQISGYNGSVQQSINCLISVRFKSSLEKIDLHRFSEEELEELFNLGSYFPRQQFRKCFRQTFLRFPLFAEPEAEYVKAGRERNLN